MYTIPAGSACWRDFRPANLGLLYWPSRPAAAGSPATKEPCDDLPGRPAIPPGQPQRRGDEHTQERRDPDEHRDLRRLRGWRRLHTTEGRAKLANLKRDPRCTILVARPDWSRYVVLEGIAQVRAQGRTDPEQLRAILRDVYRAASGEDHPDWDEYDRAMVRDRRAAVIVIPERVYGSGAGA